MIGVAEKLLDLKFRWMQVCALALALCGIMLCSGGCDSSKDGDPYYGRVAVPRAQEFRWSDGGLPQIFDPALAETPPDTDAVRALYEGLTDYDSRSLTPIAAVASRWESSEDARTWMFYLRHDAHWSNNEPVTAHDFVRSWQRTLRLGERAPHANLLENIVGARSGVASPPELLTPPRAAAGTEAKSKAKENSGAPGSAPAFGVEAIDDYTLRVRLQRPDKNFPALVAHPVFRPVSADITDRGLQLGQSDSRTGSASPSLVTNGAFRLLELAPDSVVLERATNYWDAETVNLERVRFVARRDAESALAAYYAGQIDAVTNAPFEPLALKLLSSYKDFRRSTYGALTYYIFNTAHAPFDDPRVREALVEALDLDRLSFDVMNGATEPARGFLPAQSIDHGSDKDRDSGNSDEKVTPVFEHNTERARRLLAEAGFPGGANFPRIRLLINRSDQQQRFARAVADMWHSALGLVTQVIVRNWDDYEAAMNAGDYDIARRSMVMQTTDEEVNMLMIFNHETPSTNAKAGPPEAGQQPKDSTASVRKQVQENATGKQAAPELSSPPILTETEALCELPAIPMYFASSYALVKPYVAGFDANLLDIPDLKRVKINTSWSPPAENEIIRLEPEQ